MSDSHRLNVHRSYPVFSSPLCLLSHWPENASWLFFFPARVFLFTVTESISQRDVISLPPYSQYAKLFCRHVIFIMSTFLPSCGRDKTFWTTKKIWNARIIDDHHLFFVTLEKSGIDTTFVLELLVFCLAHNSLAHRMNERVSHKSINRYSRS